MQQGYFFGLWQTVCKAIPGVTLRTRKPGRQFAVTIGRTIWVPDDFHTENWTDVDRFEVLAHEFRHLVRQRYWPFSFLAFPVLWRVNFLIHGLLYILPALPWCWNFRWYFEREAYAIGLRARAFAGEQLTYGHAMRMAETVSSKGYLFMVTKARALRWAVAEIEKIRRELQAA